MYKQIGDSKQKKEEKSTETKNKIKKREHFSCMDMCTTTGLLSSLWASHFFGVLILLWERAYWMLQAATSLSSVVVVLPYVFQSNISALIIDFRWSHTCSPVFRNPFTVLYAKKSLNKWLSLLFSSLTSTCGISFSKSVRIFFYHIDWIGDF